MRKDTKQALKDVAKRLREATIGEHEPLLHQLDRLVSQAWEEGQDEKAQVTGKLAELDAEIERRVKADIERHKAECDKQLAEHRTATEAELRGRFEEAMNDGRRELDAYRKEVEIVEITKQTVIDWTDRLPTICCYNAGDEAEVQRMAWYGLVGHAECCLRNLSDTTGDVYKVICLGDKREVVIVLKEQDAKKMGWKMTVNEPWPPGFGRWFKNRVRKIAKR